MAKIPTPTNSACCPGCTCPCCQCSCPYCCLGVLIDQLVAKGIAPDAAAKVAADFISQQCCNNCDVAAQVKP
jgi:hypothetical protein